MAYMNAMGWLSAAYPDDHEARAFHSLSILGSTDGERDFGTYIKAASVAQPIFDANPDHPGAVHYMIHSFDDPVHAPLGLEAARAYSEIAPGAGHAQHMTSHIFVALSMWDDVVSANVRARDVQNAREEELGRPPNVCGHYTSWLHYGWLMQGKIADAERGMAECRERALNSIVASETNYFVNMRARHVLDLRDWSAAGRLAADVDHPGYDFIDAYAAIKSGNIELGQRRTDWLKARSDADQPRQQIAIMELDALLALDAGESDRAIKLLEEAAALEESLPFEFAPPASLKPPHELLGEVLAAVGDHAAALTAFRAALNFTPERGPSLMGLAEAASALGDQATAMDARERLEHIMRNADAGVAPRLPNRRE